INLVERLLVPEAKSSRSTSATLSPRDTASNAMPAPVIPPPITSKSKRSLLSRSSSCSLKVTETPCDAIPWKSRVLFFSPSFRTFNGAKPSLVQTLTGFLIHPGRKRPVNGARRHDIVFGPHPTGNSREKCRTHRSGFNYGRPLDTCSENVSLNLHEHIVGCTATINLER